MEGWMRFQRLKFLAHTEKGTCINSILGHTTTKIVYGVTFKIMTP